LLSFTRVVYEKVKSAGKFIVIHSGDFL